MYKRQVQNMFLGFIYDENDKIIGYLQGHYLTHLTFIDSGFQS